MDDEETTPVDKEPSTDGKEEEEKAPAQVKEDSGTEEEEKPENKASSNEVKGEEEEEAPPPPDPVVVAPAPPEAEPEEVVEEDDLGDEYYNSTSSALTEDRWEEMFQRLLEFKEVHGHCLVPNRYKEDLQLGAWVSGQRKNYKFLQSGSGKHTPMTMERANRLMGVGFEWTAKNPRHLMWEVRFAELRDFKNNYGHSQVPIGWEQNVQLANWVSTQRQEYKNLIKGKTSRLNDKRVTMLNELGFAWELQRGGRRRRLAANRSGTNGTPNPPHPADLEAAGKTRDFPFDDDKFAIDDGTSPVKRSIPGGRKRTTLKKKMTSVDDSTKCILPGVAIMGGGGRDAPIKSPMQGTNGRRQSGGGNSDNSPMSNQNRGMQQQQQAMIRAALQGQAGGQQNPWQMLPNGAYQQNGNPFAQFMGGNPFFPMAANPFGMNPFAGQGGNMDPSQFNNGGPNGGMNPQEAHLRRMQQMQQFNMGMQGQQQPFNVPSNSNINNGQDNKLQEDGDGMQQQQNQQGNNGQQMNNQGMGGMPGQFGPGGWQGQGGPFGNNMNMPTNPAQAAAAAAAAQHLQAAAALTAGMDQSALPPGLAQMASMAQQMNGGMPNGMGGGGGNNGGGDMNGGQGGGNMNNMNTMGMNGMNGMGMNMGMSGMNGMNMNNPMMAQQYQQQQQQQSRGRRGDPPADPPSSGFSGMMPDGAVGGQSSPISNNKRKLPIGGGQSGMTRKTRKQDIFEDADEN